jgi:hypothetical protein
MRSALLTILASLCCCGCVRFVDACYDLWVRATLGSDQVTISFVPWDGSVINQLLAMTLLSI